jgi:pectin methylesterase-like acyl-CoA thioesterase
MKKNQSRLLNYLFPLLLAVMVLSMLPVTAAVVDGSISIACGSSSAVGSFQADQSYSGGSTYRNSNTVDVSQITSNPPPAALFNNERYGAMSYTIPGFTAGSSYAVTLYFAETYLTASGKRLFGVTINGATALSNFDIYASAGGQNKAIARSFTTMANSSGQIVIQFTSVTENPKINGISINPSGSSPTPTNTPTPTRTRGNTPTPTPTRVGPTPTATPTPTPGSGSISIAAGRTSALGSFQADQYYSGGSTYSNTNTVDVSQIPSSPPPVALFNNERYGAFSYTIPGFTAGSSYAVTLYFAETYLTSSGKRLFGVTINGSTVLSNFDIYASAGGQNKAIARSFSATANSNGQIVIQFISSTDNPKINGISIKPGTAPPTPTPTRGTVPTPTKTPTPTSGSYNAVVAKDGSGNYSTVQAAINAVPDNNQSWFKIYIKNGTYREVITVSSTKTYVWLIGQSNTGTILTYSNCSDTAGGTSNSASFFAKAKNFKAENLTFENAFDYNNSSYTNKQAVALEPYADRQTYTNCRITGWQDTLFVRAGRQYFKSCYISGVVDFIFGEGTAVFDRCEIRARSRSSGCFSAPSTLATTAYGLVFFHCTLTADSGVPSSSFWLGRPWHPSSSTGVKSAATYLYCSMGSFVQTNGWTSMSGVYPSTERLREYKNTGAGAVINSSRPQLSDSEAANYTVTNVLKGSDGWNPTSF